ncbi:hypothetical protein CC80DRAFT_255492 [Byssothecium circinans]|uniref:Uncharacterized protein n=1 Tax=Byssothecium circinans TaxID=147558 RepID=A0A6A5TCY2_9PLEO|nr:hypothetical protein CC80DRAFT_255492 [Byssothecium circinans]
MERLSLGLSTVGVRVCCSFEVEAHIHVLYCTIHRLQVEGGGGSRPKMKDGKRTVRALHPRCFSPSELTEDLRLATVYPREGGTS